MMLLNEVKKAAAAVFPRVVDFRRHLHQYPELSFEEKKTGQYISRQLSDMGIDHQHGWAENGSVGIITGTKTESGPTIALRADIDALPILEKNEVSYKSKNEGVMHACGHDVHTASLLGTAMILHQVRDHFSGRIKLIFQPAEERLPGGASILIKEGVLENPRPAGIFGQHVHPPLEAGKVGFCPGQYMASADEVYLTVKGRGGHGALPQNCVDPLVITSQIVLALQQVVSRQANPLTPTVLTFGKIHSEGGATNIIPNEIKLEGTFRTMDEEWRMQAHKNMKQIAEQIAVGYGGSCEMNVVVGMPSLYNNVSLTQKARNYAVEYLGPNQVVDLPPRMTAEDFSYYSQVIPACFYRLGTGNAEKGITSPVHTNTFDIDEDSLQLSTGLMAWLALRQMQEG